MSHFQNSDGLDGILFKEIKSNTFKISEQLFPQNICIKKM